jgi:hypothetical protein
MLTNSFKNKLPTPEWLERQYKLEREISEVCLKYISWSLLLAAIYVSYIKSGNVLLLVGTFIVGGLLYCYLHGHIMRIQINIVPAEKVTELRYFILSVGIYVVIVTTMLVGATMFSVYVVKALVGVQLPK